MAPVIDAALPVWPVPGIEAIRERWADRAEDFTSGPDYAFDWVPNQPPGPPRDLQGTERWDISFGESPEGLKNTITVHLSPVDTYTEDPDFEQAFGWKPRGEVWIEVWKSEDVLGLFMHACELVAEIAEACTGLVGLDPDKGPPDGYRRTDFGVYVTADVFRDMMLEPGFARRMC